MFFSVEEALLESRNPSGLTFGSPFRSSKWLLKSICPFVVLSGTSSLRKIQEGNFGKSAGHVQSCLLSGYRTRLLGKPPSEIIFCLPFGSSPESGGDFEMKDLPVLQGS